MSQAIDIQKGRHVPVEPGFWMLIFGDLLVFGIMFVAFIVRRYESVGTYQVFSDGSASLNQGIGFANTLVLLTSSYFVARAVIFYRSAKFVRCDRQLSKGLLLSLVFILLKFYEYYEKINQGVSVTSTSFYEFYFAFTGVHLLHVMIGSVLILFLKIRCRAEVSENKHGSTALVEGVACYWHMVDMLWLVLFSLFYLIA